MKDITLNVTQYLEGVLLVVCIFAVPYYLYRARLQFKTDQVMKVNGAGGKLFLAFIFFAVVKTQLMVPRGVQPYVFDGERGVYTKPNLFWLNEKVELTLQYDPEIQSRLWMAEDGQGHYPFFVEPGADGY